MSPEPDHTSPKELDFNRELALEVLLDPQVNRLLVKGANAANGNVPRETGFLVVHDEDGIRPSGLVRGYASGQIIGGSMDDFMDGRAQMVVTHSTAIAKARVVNPKEAVQVASFHWHPSGNPTPSSADADYATNRSSGLSKQSLRAHPKCMHGILAYNNHDYDRKRLKAVFFGLSKGLLNNQYQAHDSLNRSSGFPEAMRSSGFWVIEGTAEIISAKGEDGKRIKTIKWNEQLLQGISDQFAG